MKKNYSPGALAMAILCISFLTSFNLFAQVGIGTTTPDNNSKLDITSTVASPGGLLLPRLALIATNSPSPLTGPITPGMTVYNTATAGPVAFRVTPGFYYHDGSIWVRIATAAMVSNNWAITGNAGTNPGTNFLGTTDNNALQFRTNNIGQFEITTDGRFRATDPGTAGAPIYSWGSDSDIGMFRQSANVLGFSTNGTERLRLPNANQVHAMNDGTAGLPFYSWGTTNNNNTGMFLPALRTIGFSTNGTERFRIPNANQVHAMNNGTAALPFYSWSANSGTGMYQAAANTLGFSTNGSERIRFLANGQVIVNAITPLANNRFTVQGATDEFAINGLTSGVGVAGIYGENNAGNGIGVFGNVGVGFGVVGQSTGAGQGVRGSNTGSGRGVIGFSESTGTGVQGQNSGTGAGVAGFSESIGVGVYGTNTGNGDGVVGLVSGPGDGVFGQNTGAGYGVHGLSNNAQSFAMKATNINIQGTGILGTGNGQGGTYLESGTGVAGTGNSGVFGYGLGSTGTGIIGAGNESNSIVIYPYGSGVAGSGHKNGVFGYAGNGDAILANRGNAAGIFQLDTDNDIDTEGNNDTRAQALLAGYDYLQPQGTNSPQHSYFGGYFSGGNVNNSPTYAYVGMRWRSTGIGASNVNTRDYKIIGTGSVSTLVIDGTNNPRVLFAPEAPEVVFQDYGIGQLINGQAVISLDPLLTKSIFVDALNPLKVFITLEGECKGIYVTNKSANGFTVKELQNGRSNVSFSWQIVASRADTRDLDGNIVSKHVGVRFPIGPGPMETPNAKKLETKKIDNGNELKKEKTGSLKSFIGRKISTSVPIDGNESMVESQSPSQENVSTVKKQF